MSSDKYYWPGWAADPEEGFGAVLRYSVSGGLEFHDGTVSGTFHPLKESLLGTVTSGSGGEYCFLNQTGSWQSLSAGNGLRFSAGTFSLNLGGGTAGQYLCLDSDGSSFTWKSGASPIQLTDLSDVSSGNLEEGYALCWNGSAWQGSSVAVLGPDGISAIASQATESKINETKLTDLTDVSSSGLTSGGVLCYNGSSWQTSQFSAGTAGSGLLNQQVEVGSGKSVSDLGGLQAIVTQADSTCAILTDDEYPGSSAVVLHGEEIELRWDDAHKAANRQVLLHQPLVFSGFRKVKLEGVKINLVDSTVAVTMEEGGLLRMNNTTCEHCSKCVAVDVGGLVYLEDRNCFGQGVTIGIYLTNAASALTKEGEMLNMAWYPALPGYGSSSYQMTKNEIVYDSASLEDNGIIIMTPDEFHLISANFCMSGVTIASGSRISVGPNADGCDIQIASGGNLRMHLGEQTNFTGSSGGRAINISSGVWSGFCGNVSSMIIDRRGVVDHFSGSADVRVEKWGIFSSSVLTGGTLTICSGGTVADVTLGNGVTSTRL